MERRPHNLRNGKARSPRKWEEVMKISEPPSQSGRGPEERDWPATSAGEEDDHSEITMQVLDGSTMTATVKDVITTEEAARLNQALVLQCSLVALQDSPKKNQKEEHGMRFLAEEQKVSWKNLNLRLSTAIVGRLVEGPGSLCR